MDSDAHTSLALYATDFTILAQPGHRRMQDLATTTGGEGTCQTRVGSQRSYPALGGVHHIPIQFWLVWIADVTDPTGDEAKLLGPWLR